MDRQERPASGREMQVIEYVAALDAQLTAHQDTLRERLKLVPNGWRQWRLMTATAGALLMALYDTLPLTSLKHIANLCKHGEVLVRVKPAAHTPGEIRASEDALREIINTAMAAECAICIRDDREIKACRLRRAMMEVVPPDELTEYGCAYRNVAAQSEHKEYI